MGRRVVNACQRLSLTHQWQAITRHRLGRHPVGFSNREEAVNRSFDSCLIDDLHILDDTKANPVGVTPVVLELFDDHRRLVANDGCFQQVDLLGECPSVELYVPNRFSLHHPIGENLPRARDIGWLEIQL